VDVTGVAGQLRIMEVSNMLALNLALAVFALVGSLAAFGGDTWEKGTAPVLRRVTGRGWVALVCLLLAFLLGGIKEILLHRESRAEAAIKQALESENKKQQEEIARQLRVIGGLQAQLESSANSLSSTTERIGGQQLASIEAAFSIAIKAPRETDDAVVHLRGNPVVPIPSRYNPEMQLYWGDQFHFVLMPEGDVPVSELASLKLEVGERTYPLHDGTGSGFFERTLRIYGKSPRPMLARILNPNRLAGVFLKIFVRTTDSSQGQEEFRRLILTSPFREFAQKIYKATTPDILNVRANPDVAAAVRSRLTRGSFVRVLQTQGVWTEVRTPEGRQGWVTSQSLGQIE
jgi:hypothetical protein